MRKITAACAAAAAAGLGLALAVIPAGASTATTATSTTLHYTSNWAGYEAAAKSGSTVKAFTSVSAEFTVPSVNCQNTPNADVGFFVVLGPPGQPSGVGIREHCTGGTPDYEVVALNCGSEARAMFTPAVNPGDAFSLFAGFSSHGNIVGDYSNLSVGGGGGEIVGKLCANRSSAGVLTYGNYNGDTADFTQAGFRQVQVEGNTQSSLQPLVSPAWNVAEYALKGPSGRVDVKPEALLSGKYTSSFATDWNSPN